MYGAQRLFCARGGVSRIGTADMGFQGKVGDLLAELTGWWASDGWSLRGRSGLLSSVSVAPLGKSPRAAAAQPLRLAAWRPASGMPGHTLSWCNPLA